MGPHLLEQAQAQRWCTTLATEAAVAVRALNRMLAFGRPISVRIA